MLYLYMQDTAVQFLVEMFPHCMYFSAQVQLLGLVPTLVRELEPFFWTMYSVLALRAD